SKQEESAGFHPIQRLDAEAIAHKCQGAVAPIPRADREHSDETLDGRLDTIGREGLKHHFRIGTTTKFDSARFKLGTKLLEIIDFAIVWDDEAAVRRDHRLMACGRKIDDGEAAVRKGNACVGINPHAMIVGTAISDALGHRDRMLFELIACAHRSYDACNSAHRSKLETGFRVHSRDSDY